MNQGELHRFARHAARSHPWSAHEIGAAVRAMLSTASTLNRRPGAIGRAIAEAVEGERCSGVAATWCPVHGDCTCGRDYEDPGDCPLHAFDSEHAEPLP